MAGLGGLRRAANWCLVALLLFAAHAATARAQAVDLLLVLAVDGSGSIDDDEFRFQREGYAAAITHPQVLRAMTDGPHRAVGILFMEWGSPGGAQVVVDWARINDAASAELFAAQILAAPRGNQTYNAIGDAIVLATNLIKRSPLAAARGVIDISGDGPDLRSLVGAPVARDAAVAEGITINALAILNRGGFVRGPGGMPLDEHYRQAVVGGPGAFVMTADDYRSFAQAIYNKLIREVAEAIAR